MSAVHQTERCESGVTRVTGMETTSNAELLQSFKDFFDRKSAILLEPTKCEWCGSTLEYFDLLGISIGGFAYLFWESYSVTTR